MALAAAAAPPHPAVVENYGPLPMDILRAILLRLAADEVCRLRLVCRSWRSLTSDRLFTAAHASRHQHVIVVLNRVGSNDMEAEVHVVDQHGKVGKQSRICIRHRVRDCLSLDGDLLCAAQGWGLACVVDVVTGVVVADVAAGHPMKKKAMVPQWMLGQVPSTGEYKVIRARLTGRGAEELKSAALKGH